MITKVLGRLGLIGFTLVITVVLVEVASRFVFPQWAPVGGDRAYWQYDETLGWSHRPNQRGRFEFEDFSADVAINSAGLRDEEHPLERVPGKKRMLLLGDSATWGFGVEQRETYGEILERRHPDWEVINAGVSGYGTDQEYLYYKTKGAAYQPDVVLVLFSGNDPENNFHSVQYWHNKPLFRVEGEGIQLTNVPVPTASFSQMLANYVAKNTYFLRTTAHMFAQMSRGNPKSEVFAEQRNDGGPSHEARPADVPADPLTVAKDELALRILLALDEAVVENGARLVIVGSTLGGPPRNLVFADPRFVGSRIPYRSLTGAFKGAKEPARFEHDPHWTPHGHTIVADKVEQFLIELGIFAGPGNENSPGA